MTPKKSKIVGAVFQNENTLPVMCDINKELKFLKHIFKLNGYFYVTSRISGNK